MIATWFYYKFGLPDTYSGPLLAIAGITIGLFAVVSPKVSGWFGLARSIVLTQGFSTIFMFSLVFVPNAAVAGLIYVVRAALMNMSAPLSDSFLMGITPFRGERPGELGPHHLLEASQQCHRHSRLGHPPVWKLRPSLLAGNDLLRRFHLSFYAAFRKVRPVG